MTHDDPLKLHRRSIRLKGYDYASAGAYFVTICTQGRECTLGEIVAEQGEMRLNDWGQIVAKWWDEIPRHFPHLELDAFVVMPNHVHGILSVGAGSPRPVMGATTGAETAPQLEIAPQSKRPTLGQIVAYFKYQSTKSINTLRTMPGARVWQRNYYERIVRNERELNAIRRYIENNPLQWALDRDHPALGRPEAKTADDYWP